MKKILLGGAIAANQAEGAWDVDGKLPSVADLRRYNPNLNRKDMNTERWMTKEKLDEALNPPKDMVFPKRHGIDFYHHYKEDIKLFAELGMQIFRTSIAWTRIYPKGIEETPNQKGLDFYRLMFEECKKYGIKLLVTISHYDMPYYLVEKYGGWKNKVLINLYVKYAKTVYNEYKDLVEYWIPFNEINAAIYSGWYGAGMRDDEAKDMFPSRYQAMHNLFVANALATIEGHKINPNFKIGTMLAGHFSYAETCKPIDNLAALKDQQIKTHFYFEVMSNGAYPAYMKKYFEMKGIKLDITEEELKILKEGVSDFNGFTYYHSGTVNGDKIQNNLVEGNLMKFGRNPYLEANEWGWQIDPLELRVVMNEIYLRYKKPIFIGENGIGKIEHMANEKDTIQDDYRIDYLRNHFKVIKDAIEIDGVDLIGYTTWTPIDIISNGTSEMSKRYGLIYVDQDDYGNGTLKRYKKKSFDWFKKAIESNLENLD